jgi:hypothetical protein
MQNLQKCFCLINYKPKKLNIKSMTFRPLVWTSLVKEKDGHMWGLTGLFNKHQSHGQTNLPIYNTTIQIH